MTNDDALICIGTSQKIMRNLLVTLVGQAVADEIMGGGVTTAAPAGQVGALLTVKGTYDAGSTTFVETQANVDALDDVADAITAIEIGDFASEAGDAYDALQTASPEVATP